MILDERVRVRVRVSLRGNLTTNSTLHRRQSYRITTITASQFVFPQDTAFIVGCGRLFPLSSLFVKIPGRTDADGMPQTHRPTDRRTTATATTLNAPSSFGKTSRLKRTEGARGDGGEREGEAESHTRYDERLCCCCCCCCG